MTPTPTPLLAIQVEGLEFALEPGREYTLGSHPHCDVPLSRAGLPPIAARITLGNGVASIKPAGGRPHALAVGDSMLLFQLRLAVVADGGAAVLLPVPALRLARRQATAAAVDAANAHADGEPRRRAGSEATTFTDLLAGELRRAPWFLLSTLLHALLLLLLLWLLPAAVDDAETPAIVGFAGALGPGASPPAAPTPPTVEIEAASPTEPTLASTPMTATAEPATNPLEQGATPTSRDLRRVGFDRVAPRRPPGSGGNGDILDAGNGSGSGAFRQTVSDLRRRGLDAMFVIDSTRSMNTSIAAAKRGIADMLEVLRALVPDARFGVITYRDRGAAEDYLVRELPLGSDFYATVNFVQSIVADGGGDVPEAVLDGMQAACRQAWRPGARRVVILAGDAPPHRPQRQALFEEVRRFAAARESFVHTLITGTSAAPTDVGADFQRIAELGKGVAGNVRDHARMLREVLTLAFGSQFDGDLQAIQERLAAARRSPPTWALQLARSGGLELARALAKDPVPADVVDALVRLPRRHVARELATLLGSDSLPDAGRQAAAFVLQRGLALDNVPIDPERPRALPRHVVQELQEMALRLPE